MALVCAGAVILALPRCARASDTAHAPRGAAPAAPAASAASAVRVREEVPIDPMERLRERLSQRLGTRAVSSSLGGAPLRVVAHPGDEAKPLPRALPPVRRPSHPALPAHWSYDGLGGPDAWAKLNPEFATCGLGMRQSPIDIQGGIRVQLDPIVFDYKAGPYRVLDNGHTIQVNVAPGSTLEVNGRRYELQQFHFHRPSEERVDGKRYEMVVHLVHRDGEGRLAVVAVLLERGAAQGVVQAVWNHLPLEKGDEVAVSAPLDAAALLPDDRGYYTYMGSLTTPPCSEGVLWMVMKKPVALSAEQIAIFGRLYPMNARPVQAASGRLIKESE
jgi:carbonic anhydrase